jgi:Ca2+-binding RTX toxin-like protein
MRYHGYTSLGQELPGLVKRRFAESELFGLYDDNVSSDEAKQVFKMLEKHRADIARKEAQYGTAFDGSPGTRNMVTEANASYATLLSAYLEDGEVNSLVENLQPAKEKLLADLRDFHLDIADKLSNDSFIATNIYLNPHKPSDIDQFSILNSLKYETLYPNGANDLMIGMDQIDIMFAGKGNDVLIGEGGSDCLWGDEGDDVLWGGAGNDFFSVV